MGKDVDFAIVKPGRGKENYFVVTYRTRGFYGYDDECESEKNECNFSRRNKQNYYDKQERVTRVIIVCDRNQTQPLLEKMKVSYTRRRIFYTFKLSAAEACMPSKEQMKEEIEDCWNEEDEEYCLKFFFLFLFLTKLLTKKNQTKIAK